MVDEDHWRYNCEDTVRTLEIAQVLRRNLASMDLRRVFEAQQEMFMPVLQAMLDGVRIDQAARAEMSRELAHRMKDCETFLTDVIGHPFNPRSSKQMKALFYDDLKLPKQTSRKSGQLTLDDDALRKLAIREPIVRPIIDKITEYRTLGVFLGTFVNAEIDEDGRMRCSYNVCGTETYRLSSGTNAFGRGTNLQNIPKGSSNLPNIRKLFIPDPGYTFFDLDLERADLYVVVWEAADTELKQALREGVDIHEVNAKSLNISRQLAKAWVHGSNYGAGPRTMAINCGITVHSAEGMQRRWFEAHPGIRAWHRRVEADLQRSRTVTNRFGYRRHYFDRLEGLLPQALAWIPQSTVAILINRIWRKLFDNLPGVRVLLQVHDSLAGQFQGEDNMESRIRESVAIPIPYPDPLIIPVNIKTSTKSWGDCE